jgi:hypothetical protein
MGAEAKQTLKQFLAIGPAGLFARQNISTKETLSRCTLPFTPNKSILKLELIEYPYRWVLKNQSPYLTDY